MNLVRHGISGGCARTAWRVGGLLVAFVGVACFVLAGPLFVHTLAFAEEHLSHDRSITPETVVRMPGLLVSYGVVFLCIGVLIILRPQVLSEATSRFRVLYIDSSDRQFSLILHWSSSIAGLVLVGLWFLKALPIVHLLYGEDGLLEMLTAILFVISSVLLFRAALSHGRRSAKPHMVMVALLIGASLLFLFFGLEEISWGQRLFGWKTPAALERINKQGELNVHNLLNELPRLYRWGTVALSSLTVAGWMVAKRRKGAMLRFLVPHPATAGLLLLIVLFGAVWRECELLEQLGAVFALSYALTALRTSRMRPHVTCA